MYLVPFAPSHPHHDPTMLHSLFLLAACCCKQASLLGGYAQDAPFFGWRSGSDGETERADTTLSLTEGEAEAGRGGAGHDWGAMVQGVQNFIKSLNFKYRTDLRSKGVREQ